MAGVIHSSPSLTLLVLLILVSWETGRAVNPGLRTALTSKGLNYSELSIHLATTHSYNIAMELINILPE